MKKAVSTATAMALSMMVGLMGVNVNVNASAYEAGSYDGVSITMLNTKSEIESQLEAAAEQWGELTGAKLEVYTIGSGTPSQEVSARYAAKNAPTVFSWDITQQTAKYDSNVYVSVPQTAES